MTRKPSSWPPARRGGEGKGRKSPQDYEANPNFFNQQGVVGKRRTFLTLTDKLHSQSRVGKTGKKKPTEKERYDTKKKKKTQNRAKLTTTGQTERIKEHGETRDSVSY